MASEREDAIRLARLFANDRGCDPKLSLLARQLLRAETELEQWQVAVGMPLEEAERLAREEKG